MKLEIPEYAQAVIAECAQRYGVKPAELLRPHPRPPEPEAARAEAIAQLAEANLGGKPRYTMTQIGAWFGISTQQIYKHRARSPNFQRRRQGSRARFLKGHENGAVGG